MIGFAAERLMELVDASDATYLYVRRGGRAVSDAAIIAVGIFANDDAVLHLFRTLPIEQNDVWAVQWARYLMLDPVFSLEDDPLTSLLSVKGRSAWLERNFR